MTDRCGGARAPEQKRLPVAIEDVAVDGTFSGYASLFGKVDLGRDRVARGAFARSLTQRPASAVRMLFQHDPDEPIGTWLSIAEDARGLRVRGRIIGSAAKGAEVLSLMRAGAIDGLSVGFRTQKSRTDRKSGIRTILQADLWEISIVTFPMLPQARVQQVKATNSCHTRTRLPSIRIFERWLTRDAGLTRSQARTVIGKGFAHLKSRQDAAEPETAAMAERLRQATSSIKATLSRKPT